MEAKFEKINSKTVEQYIQYRSEKIQEQELRTGYQNLKMDTIKLRKLDSNW